MAGQYEGFTLGFKAQDAALKESEKTLGAVNAQLVKVRENASKMRISPEFPKEINHINTVTASYIQRLEAEGRTYKANQEKVKAYRFALSELTAKQKDLESGLSRIKEKSGVASSAYRAQKIQINQTAASVTKLQRTINELHPTGFDRVTTKIKKAEAASQSLKSTLRSGWDNIKGGAMAAAAGIGAIGTAAISGARKAASLQQTYKEVNNLAVLGGEKQKEVTKAVRDMQASGRDMALKYGKSQQEVAEGYEDLIKRGYSTKQALGSMRTEMQASVASGDDFKDVTTVSSQVIESFGLKANSTAGMIRNTKKAVNELAYSADMTSTGFHSLGDAVHYFGAAAKAQHISLAESASAVGVLSNNGVEGSMAGTAMRDIVNRIGSNLTKIGKKNSIFDQLGIKKSEIENSKGHIKSLSSAMSTIYKHIKQHSKDSVQEQGFFKSIFGTTAQNAATILAKNSKQVEELTRKTEKAGNKGSYVSQLAAKNMNTAQGAMAQAKQSAQAFEMTLGSALLPAINKASNSLSKFLLTKDGEKFQKDVGNAVGKVANGLVDLIKWASSHKTEVKFIGYGLLAGWSIGKATKFVGWLGEVKDGFSKLRGSVGIVDKLATGTGKFTSGLFGKGAANEGPAAVMERAKPTGAGWLSGSLQSMRSAGGWSNLQTAGKVAHIAAGIGVGIDAGMQGFNAFKDRHNADKRSTDIGGAIGTVAGGALGTFFGPVGTIIGSQIGKGVGKAGGYAVNQFTKGWQKNKPPKDFWSLKNLGWSTHNMFKQMGSGWNHFWGGMGDWRKQQAKGIGKWASDVGKGWNNGVKGVKSWFNQLPSNIGKTGNSIKSWAGKVGNNIHRGFDKGMDASHNFIRNVPKNIGKAGKSIQRGWNATWKKVNNNRYVKAFQRGKFVQTASKDISSNWKKFSTKFGKDWNSTWKKTQKSAGKAWNSTKRATGKALNGIQSGYKKFSTDFGKKWSAGWKSVNENRYVKAFKHGELMKTFAKDTWSRWQSFSTKFGKGWSSFWGGLSKGWNNFWGKAGDMAKGVSNNARGFINKVIWGMGGKKTTWGYIKGHAAGGYISAGHGALVGEAGPELAYKAGSNARLLGANGPEITKVHAGEHILNARDTQKVMSGGLGQGLILKGYANGNTTVKKTKNNLNTIKKNSSNTWKAVVRDTKRQTIQNSRNTTNAFTDMRKGVHKQMTETKTGTIELAKSTAKGFGKAMDKMKTYARSAMGGTIDEINRGIRGIDKVLGQFGGNASVIKPVHFAAGTDSNGRLTKNTYAMVNDATSGPRQEALISDKNEVYLPRGNNLTMMIPKGWGVLNGSQTHQAGLTHFAKGSGVSHKLLEKIASNALKDPAKSFRNMYSSNLHEGGTDIKKGTIGLAQRASTRYGDPWSNAMWTVINNAIDDGDGGPASGLLAAVEKYGEGHRYVWGATGPTTFDCSGLVMYALNKKYGIKYPHFSGSQYSMTEHISKANAKMGDLVFWGAGGSDHVGVYAGHNKYFSAQSPSQGIHMNTLSSVVGKGSPLFGRVKGLSQGHETKKHTADKRLIALAKQELGSRAIKWIKDNLGDGGSYANPAGDGVARWRPLVKKALRANGFGATPSQVNAWMRVIARESGGNPRAVNNWDSNAAAGTPSKGLVQTIEPTFNAYAKRGHHNIFNGYDNLLAGINYMAHKYGRGASAFARVSGPEGYAKGGDPKVGDTVLVGENGPELAQFKHPVHVYSNSQSHNLLSNLSKKKIPTGKTINPTINININGPIGGSESEAKKVAEVVKAELTKYFIQIGDEFGDDLSNY